MLTQNRVTYVHANSGIPLIGNVAFGIVYRNSSIVEIKPVTSCNLDCVYCSISEGLTSKKHDFVVEADYLLEELENLIEFIDQPIEAHIGVQGEPFLYADMIYLIKELQKNKNIHTISIDTNATLLTTKILEDLKTCTKLQFNLSLDAINPEKAKKIAGVKNYNIEHVKNIISKASKDFKVIVAPVLVKGYNEDEIEDIIKFIKELEHKPILGIQNFLRYKTGRNPAKEITWDDFYALLDKLEKKYDMKLKLQKEDFNIKKTKTLEKPFDKDDIVNAKLICPDRFTNTSIAKAGTRTVSIPNCEFKKNKKVKVKILRSKHNIFIGKLI
jgi:hypothetical protein